MVETTEMMNFVPKFIQLLKSRIQQCFSTGDVIDSLENIWKILSGCLLALSR